MAKDANLAAIRINDCDRWATVADIVDGMEWVAENRNLPAVANLSYDAAGSAIADAAEDLIEAGVVFVIAAGNVNEDACSVAAHSVTSVLVVGALSNQSPDRRWADSNYGSCVDLYAPGEDIEIATFTGDHADHTDSGTSYAAPLVAGAAALYLERYPNDSPSARATSRANGARRLWAAGPPIPSHGPACSAARGQPYRGRWAPADC